MIEQFKAALREVAKAGRNGDSVLAHITPEEEEYLEREFGGSTINPMTGLKEYAGEPGAGRGGEGSTGGSHGGGDSGSGGGGGGRGGFGGSRGDPRGGSSGGTSAAAQGSNSAGFGGRGGGGRADPADVRSGTSGMTGTARGGTGLGAPGTDPSPSSGSAFSRALTGFISAMFGVPPNPFDLADEEKDIVGLPGMVRDTAQTVGTGLNRGLSAIGMDPQTPETDVASADPQGPTSFGAGPPGGVPAGGAGELIPPGPPSPPDFSLRRPEAMEAPMFLGLGNAMTPIQQRAKIATFGTGSEAGGYRSEPAQDYYKNIFLRSILGDEGQVRPGAQVLPVETQYAQQTLGLDTPPEMDTESFARVIADLPPKEQADAILAAWYAANPQQQEREPV